MYQNTLMVNLEESVKISLVAIDCLKEEQRGVREKINYFNDKYIDTLEKTDARKIVKRWLKEAKSSLATSRSAINCFNEALIPINNALNIHKEKIEKIASTFGENSTKMRKAVDKFQDVSSPMKTLCIQWIALLDNHSTSLSALVNNCPKIE